MIDISEEEVKKEETFDQSALEASFDTLVSGSKLSGFEKASKILKELPRDAILLNNQNDDVLQNEQEEEEKK